MRVMASGINPRFKNYAQVSKLNVAASSSLSQTSGMANNAAYPDTSVLKANFISFKGNPKNEKFNPGRVLKDAISKSNGWCFGVAERPDKILNALNKDNAPYLRPFMQHRTSRRGILDSDDIADRLRMVNIIKGKQGIDDKTKEEIIKTLAYAEENGMPRLGESAEAANATDETNVGYLQDFVKHKNGNKQKLGFYAIADRLRMVSVINNKRMDNETKEDVIRTLAYATDNDGRFRFGDPAETATFIDGTNVDYLKEFVEYESSDKRTLHFGEITNRLRMVNVINNTRMDDKTKNYVIRTLAYATDNDGSFRFGDPVRIISSIDETNVGYLKNFARYKVNGHSLSEYDIADRLEMAGMVKREQGINTKTKEEIIKTLAYAKDGQYLRFNHIDYYKILAALDERNAGNLKDIVKLRTLGGKLLSGDQIADKLKKISTKAENKERKTKEKKK